MSVENIPPLQQTLQCLICNNFNASQVLQGLCSSCYKASIKSPQKTHKLNKLVCYGEQIADQIMSQSLKLELLQRIQQKDRKRCFSCNKKLGLLGIECKCGYVYCNGHRLPQQHQCDFDFKQEGKYKLQKELVKCYNGKIQHI